MSIATWQPGTLYAPGALVRVATVAPISRVELENPGFEGGDTGWERLTGGANWTIANAGPVSGANPDGAFAGNWRARFDYPGNTDFAILRNEARGAFRAGRELEVRAAVRTNQALPAPGHLAAARLAIAWFDEQGGLISRTLGEPESSLGGYRYPIVARGVSPPGTDEVALELHAAVTGDQAWAVFDSVAWDYAEQVPTAEFNLVFRAVQADAGFSGNSEPEWPTTTGLTVVDNEVTWEAVELNVVTYVTRPILVSGSSEPDWPTQSGDAVVDGSISWVAESRRVRDPKCPNTKAVVAAASKIFAGDRDIVAFSATANPLDWSTPNDAGYLPTGMQEHGDNDVEVLGLYRSNLVVMNAGGFQLWQVDPDPANHAFLDAVPVGSTQPRAVQAVQNDLLFLAAGAGVRSIGIAGGSTSLQAGDVGAQIDPMVLAALEAFEGEPLSLYAPGLGQYWLIVGAEAFVYTLNASRATRAWSRYELPGVVTDWALLGNDLLLRSGDIVWRMDPAVEVDDFHLDTRVVTDDFSGYEHFEDAAAALPLGEYLEWNPQAGAVFSLLEELGEDVLTLGAEGLDVRLAEGVPFDVYALNLCNPTQAPLSAQVIGFDADDEPVNQRLVPDIPAGSCVDVSLDWIGVSRVLVRTVEVFDTAFTSTGSGTWNRPAGVDFVEVLVVGGGGCGGRGTGGSNTSHAGGGGGGGEVVYREFVPVSGASVAVSVGDGGAPASPPGEDSAFGDIVARGGGGCITSAQDTALRDGACGGGGSSGSTNGNQPGGLGDPGGNGGASDLSAAADVSKRGAGGGGGGASGEPGTDGVAPTWTGGDSHAADGVGGHGGDGVDLSHLFPAYGDGGWFGGGGAGARTGGGTDGVPGKGGGRASVNTTGGSTSAPANTGGGGGGQTLSTENSRLGGSGIVVVRHAVPLT